MTPEEKKVIEEAKAYFHHRSNPRYQTALWDATLELLTSIIGCQYCAQYIPVDIRDGTHRVSDNCDFIDVRCTRDDK